MSAYAHISIYGEVKKYDLGCATHSFASYH